MSLLRSSYRSFRRIPLKSVFNTRNSYGARHMSSIAQKGRAIVLPFLLGASVAGFGGLYLIHRDFERYTADVVDKVDRLELNLEQKFAAIDKKLEELSQVEKKESKTETSKSE